MPYGADDRQDVDALVKKAHEVDAKMLYLVNPDNPSGTWHESSRVEALVEALPQGCLLLVDEAYHELGIEYDANARVAVDDLRVLRLRTFSKAYGLAGARIGYALGAPRSSPPSTRSATTLASTRLGRRAPSPRWRTPPTCWWCDRGSPGAACIWGVSGGRTT